MKKINKIIYFLIILSFNPLFSQDAEYFFHYGTRGEKISAINNFMRQRTEREALLLIRSLKNENEDIYVRQYILHALRVFNQPMVKYALIWALECDNPQLRKEAVLVISKYPLNDIMYPVVNALNDKEYIVRKNALFTLALIGNKKILPFIRRLFYDEHPEVREQAKVTDLRIRQKP